MLISHIDHLVLTVADIEQTCTFYSGALGMKVITFGENRKALAFGEQKINLHPAHAPLMPHAKCPTSGSADICLITKLPLGSVIRHLQENGVQIELGPIARTGAIGVIESIYFRDPDGNLIEIGKYCG
ncbi:MAG: VOC family protein [Oceanospirillaceae bacterium]|jgi:catechol 2,3-dioxygenase-like lactoylglutathione lyase family enzyme|nr:VOC family protein [Oceanospirillaceae bacterium]MBT4442717.1 VOC family protein [Oceanospirillaceae bacterium]